MAFSNDDRGWIMACVSGIACICGACIVFVDLIIRHIPRCQDFRIQDSNTFLSSSLSLSFGVMLFTALYSMLPSCRSYLVQSGLSASAASYLLIVYFLGGAVGIQICSRFVHRFMPSHVVDCDHAHKDEESGTIETGPDHHRHASSDDNSSDHECTPLLLRDQDNYTNHDMTLSKTPTGEQALNVHAGRSTDIDTRRPSLPARFTRRVSEWFVGSKARCDEGGPCYGYSDPCGRECFKVISQSPTRLTFASYDGLTPIPRQPPPTRVATIAAGEGVAGERSARSTPRTAATWMYSRSRSPRARPTRIHERAPSRLSAVAANDDDDDDQDPAHATSGLSSSSTVAAHHDRHDHSAETTTPPHQAQHHHHVPANAFLTLGLQTSAAIALHKLPEGFITYATNHTNPRLGFSVFLALAIHNLTEGYAMALPLYLVTHSRVAAVGWSAVLGGASQPLGAGIAALWLHATSSPALLPGEGAYGALFGITAGIMTSVALQLFAESLALTHQKGLCMVWAFVGMGILGLSSALTAYD